MSATALTHALNKLPDVDAVPNLDAEDMTCLREIRDVLERHGRLLRFGVTVLHKHFDLDDGEFLLETTDVENRVQTIRPVRASELPPGADLLETSWSLQTGEVLMACARRCVKQRGVHTHEHVKTSG